MEPVYLMAGGRTAIGTSGGSRKDVPANTVARVVLAEAIARAGLAPDDVGHMVVSQAIPGTLKDAYIARVAAVEAGVPIHVLALTVNRLCGSGLQAIISMAQMIALGECDVGVAGGAESMSRAPHLSSSTRFGQRLSDVAMVDALVGTLSDPLDGVHMGVTAENVARDHGIARQAQDALAVESHARAARALAQGRFKAQIVGVEVRDRKGTRLFDANSMARLKRVFAVEGSATAGNSSGINDGVASVVLDARGDAPWARILSSGYAGGEPHGNRSGQGRGGRAATGGPDDRADRGHRGERGLCRAGLCRGRSAWLPPGQGQFERIGDCGGASDRRHRRDPDGRAAVRAGTDRGALRPGHAVHRRGGNCDAHARAIGCRFRIMALRMTRSCRATAMRIVLGALPLARILSRMAVRTGMRREALRAAM